MTRVQKIFKQVRRTLGDSKTPYRTSDDDLLDVLNEAILDISVKTRLFKGYADITLVAGKTVYTLPSDVIELNLAIFQGEPLPLVTTSYMENKVHLDWRTKTSESSLEALVYDKEDVGQIRLYPRLLQGDLLTAGGFSSSLYSNFSDLFGVVVSIDDYDVIPTPFGIAVDIIDGDSTLDSSSDVFGILSGFYENKSITVGYDRVANQITSDTEDLELPYYYDKAIKYYIAGNILRDDRSEQNRSFGAEELQLYSSIVNDITRQSEVNSTTPAVRQTQYMGIG